MEYYSSSNNLQFSKVCQLKSRNMGLAIWWQRFSWNSYLLSPESSPPNHADTVTEMILAMGSTDSIFRGKKTNLNLKTTGFYAGKLEVYHFSSQFSFFFLSQSSFFFVCFFPQSSLLAKGNYDMTVIAIPLTICSSHLVFPKGKFYRMLVSWSLTDNTVE